MRAHMHPNVLLSSHVSTPHSFLVGISAYSIADTYPMQTPWVHREKRATELPKKKNCLNLLYVQLYFVKFLSSII